MFVEDAARLLVYSELFTDSNCPIINGGTGISTTVKDILSLIGSYFNPKMIPTFSNSAKSGDPTRLVANIDNLSARGFSSSVSLQDGLEKTILWFKEFCS